MPCGVRPKQEDHPVQLEFCLQFRVSSCLCCLTQMYLMTCGLEVHRQEICQAACLLQTRPGKCGKLSVLPL